MDSELTKRVNYTVPSDIKHLVEIDFNEEYEMMPAASTSLDLGTNCNWDEPFQLMPKDCDITGTVLEV